MATPHKPHVSVVMAVKDGRKYLRQAMDSVLGQTYGDFEFIIIDDDSTDETLQILGRYDDPRIRLMQNQSHLGLSRSLNSGLNAARGEYIARMDADDVCLPERLEKQVRFLDRHAEVAALGTGIRFMDEQGKAIRDVQMPTDDALIKWKLCFMNPIAHPSVMMRRAAIDAIGGYDPELTCSQDYDLWWRLSGHNQLANLPDILMLLRQHAGQVTSVSRGEQFEFGMMINRKQLSAFVGAPVSEAASRNLWAVVSGTAKEARLSGNLLLACFNRLRRAIPSAPSRRLLEHEAVLKIVTLTEPHWGSPQTWPVLGRLVWISPRRALSLIARRLRKRITR